MKSPFFLLFCAIPVCLSSLISPADAQGSPAQRWEQKRSRVEPTRSIERDELAQIARELAPLLANENRDRSDASARTLCNLLNYRRLHPVHIGQAGAAKTAAPDLDIVWNEKNGTPAFVRNQARAPAGKFPVQQGADVLPADLVFDFLESHRDLFRLREPCSELRMVETVRDASGQDHVVLQQLHERLPVWGHDLTAHVAPGGWIYGINARYSPTPRASVAKQTITDLEAIDIASNRLRGSTPIIAFDERTASLLQYEGPAVRQFVWIDETTRKVHLIWHVEIRPNIRDRWYFFVDAHTGSILEFYNATMTEGALIAQATDLLGIERALDVYEGMDRFFLLDASRSIFQADQPDLFSDPQGALITLSAGEEDLRRSTTLFYVESEDNTWADPVSVSAHYNAGTVFSYFEGVHGRLSTDDCGATLISVVHVTDEGRSMGNAFWNGSLIAYGDGNAAFDPLAGSLDVAAHEITHGVIERTVNLEYRFQLGALNESLADVFGAMVDREDWLIGEDVVKTTIFPSGALRNMEDPHNGFSSPDNRWQPAHMDEFAEFDITFDNGGVHINSGIPNRACFLMAEAIGRDKTEQIYYRLMDARYLNTRSNFVDMRLAALRAATDLFGEGSQEEAAVVAAFDEVGIVGTEGVEAPRDTLPVTGEQWILVVNAEPNDSSPFLVRPDLNSDADIFQLTTTQLFTNTGNPTSVSDDGPLVVFVDAGNFVRAINSNGTDERIISTTGDWRSVALSPDGRRLAVTSVFADTSIFIIDLFEPSNNKSVKLYNPTTSDSVRIDIVRFADALDWDLAGEFLVYDAFNSFSEDGVTVEFWDVNLLDVDNEIIFPLFPAQPRDISIGNPSFAQTSDRYIVFDLIDFANESDQIWGIDLFTGESRLIEDNGSSFFGYPRYSPDDSQLVFQREEEGVPTLRQLSLADDRIQAAGASEPFVTEGQRPAWFGVGTREMPDDTPTNVEEAEHHADELPTNPILLQNYPNPFNSSTAIRFSLSEGAETSIRIYDLQGQLIDDLSSTFRAQGQHLVRWDGRDADGRSVASGVYVYRLSTTSATGERSTLSRKMTLLQ